MPSDTEVFSEVLDTASDELDLIDLPAELDAWVSSALGLWREPGVATDPAGDDTAFVEWLAGRAEPAARTILEVIAGFGLDTAGPRAQSHVVERSPAPEPSGAWELRSGDTDETVIVLGFAHGPDEHVLLIDIAPSGVLADVQVSTDFDPLVSVLASQIELVELGCEAAAARVAAAFAARVAEPGEHPNDSLLANLTLLRARLAGLGHGTLEPTWSIDPPMPVLDDEADRSSLAVLRSALGSARDEVCPPGAEVAIGRAAALVRWTDGSGRPVRELDALASLEWADWLGAVLGTIRAGVGTSLSGAMLVDFVNGCPEITTAIPGRDRPWFEWAFAVVIESWVDVGILDTDRRLTETGAWVLPRALAAAWGGDFDA
ncbi:MAG: hypothetical protein OEU32_00950 [Acidimicrobiia bacterium]|nr:hypothetical protein [Acidimicrobiia bacterium]